MMYFNVTDADNVHQRMTIVGVLLAFRSLAQEALLDVSVPLTFSGVHVELVK
jgi:hypothetical protein